MAGWAPGPRGLPAPPDAAWRFAIVAARFNEPIVTRLVEGARHAFAEAKVPAEAVELHWVPGSFELPLAALHLAGTRRYAAIVCVGVVIRAATPHFEHVAREAASGIRHATEPTGVPTSFGVITPYTEEQAWARAGGAVGNRGEEAAAAALEMAHFVRELAAQHPRAARGAMSRTPRQPRSRNGQAGPGRDEQTRSIGSPFEASSPPRSRSGPAQPGRDERMGGPFEAARPPRSRSGPAQPGRDERMGGMGGPFEAPHEVEDGSGSS